jgi:hypothetical protein
MDISKLQEPMQEKLEVQPIFSSPLQPSGDYLIVCDGLSVARVYRGKHTKSIVNLLVAIIREVNK